MKGLEAGGRGDYAAALKELRPLAEQGHADAQLLLGLMYSEGKGVPKDYVEALKWWRGNGGLSVDRCDVGTRNACQGRLIAKSVIFAPVGGLHSAL